MAQPLILTLDAGTTGIKCTAFQQDGHALSGFVEGYPTYYPRAGWAQQKPREQLDAALKAIRLTLQSVPAGDICALVFTGTMNGCIPIDRQGNALYDNIIHSDGRAQPQVERIASAIPPADYYATVGNRIDVHSGLPKYMWLKEHQKDVYDKAYKFVNIKDYLYGHFTGLAGCTDRSDASLCSCLDIHTGQWAWDILKLAGIDTAKMPSLLSSTDASATLCPAYARLTGLPEGLPVAVGAGDGACAAHGARRHQPGDAYMNIGSSAWVSSMSHHPILDPKMRIFNYFDMDESCYNVCGTVQCGAAAFDWAVQNLVCAGQAPQTLDFDTLEALALTAPAGSSGLFFLPTLMGERTPWWTSKASGTLIGFTLYHQRSHVVRAIYEGIMQALCQCGEILAENNLPVSSLTLIGGGAKSRLWGQMAASMFNAPVRVHQTPHEATSLGAAFAAGVGIGLYKDFHEAARQIHTRQTYQPNDGETAAYARHASVYKTLYPGMKDVYEAIYAYQQEKEII